MPLILIVDDDQAFGEIITKKLITSGFSVETAENGEIGLQKIRELKPVVALLDVTMPKLDGIGLVKAVREDPAIAKTKLILISAFGDSAPSSYNELRAKALESGADDFYLKAHDLNELIAKVRVFFPESRPNMGA